MARRNRLTLKKEKMEKHDVGVRSGKKAWWEPELLTWAMWGAVAWNCVVLWLVLTGSFNHDVGNDAAGAGMARAWPGRFRGCSRR